MKKFFFVIYLFVSVITVFAQTQQGYVKTKGRLGNDGQVIAGVRLSGATVRLIGKTVVSQASGVFSFEASNKKYAILDIQKNDYQLYDRDQLGEYDYSSNPLVLVLEKPDDREADKLMAQQKINRTLRSQLQQREDELERLKQENKITQQEYQRLYNQLYSDEKKNRDLIESMAERYASMDFDQLDEENRIIKTLILNGELQKADSIINAKGNLEDRIASYKAHKEANKQEEQELAEREKRLKKSKAVENLTLKELAEDCMNKHELYKLRSMFDSAAYYIQIRAELDTLNYDWQSEVAEYYKKQNVFALSERYYIRTLNILHSLEKKIAQFTEPDLFALYNQFVNMYLTIIYNGLANLYRDIRRFEESEDLYKSALAINESLAKSNPQEYELVLAMSYINLASLYKDIHRFAESEEVNKSALAIFERLAKPNPQAYEPLLAKSYNNLANLYNTMNRFAESEEMHKSALAIRERLAKSNPQAYEPDLADSYNNLANLYRRMHRFADSEEMHKFALAIRERLAASNPQAYDPDLAGSYNNLANLYSDIQRFADSEELYKSALAIRERLAKSNPQAYEPDLANSYFNLALLYDQTQRFADSEGLYKSALAIRERLAKSNPQAYDLALANSYYNLAILYSDTQRFTESEEMYKSALEICLRLYNGNPQIYEIHLMQCYYWLGRTMLLLEKVHEAQGPFRQSLNLARNQIKTGTDTSLYWESLYYLSNISSFEKDYASAYTYNEELLPLLNAYYKQEAEKWKADYSNQLVNQSFYANLLGKFEEGEQYSLEALKVDSAKHLAYTNLAAALLLQGKVEEAEELYRQYKAEFKDGFLGDFAEFDRLGIIPEERKKDVERIKAMLNEP